MVSYWEMNTDWQDRIGPNTFTSTGVASVSGGMNDGNKAQFLLTGSRKLQKTSPVNIETQAGKSFSFRFWIQVESMPGAREILSLTPDNSFTAGWVIRLGAGAGNIWSFVFGTSAGKKFVNHPTLATADSPTWHMITCVHDYGVGQSVYLDGVQSFSAETLTDVVDSSGSPIIVGDILGGGVHSHMHIDEIAFWQDRALTPSDVVWDYNNGEGRTFNQLSGAGSLIASGIV